MECMGFARVEKMCVKHSVARRLNLSEKHTMSGKSQVNLGRLVLNLHY